MTSISKNLNHCRKCVCLTPIRRLNTGSPNATELAKLNVKSIVISQWKLINGLKTYFSKCTKDNNSIANALNKEFAVFLQKIDAKTYGNGLLQYFSMPKEMDKKKNLKEVVPVGNGEEEKTVYVPNWKMARLASVSNEQILDKTNQLVKSLALPQISKFDAQSYLEELIAHIKSHPEAKHIAVKNGVIRNLLSIRCKSTSEEILGALNEALAVLGYTDPVSGNGIKILSIDGGGTKGIIVIEMLKKLQELTGRPLYESFDIVCGVSTGAIITTLLGLKQKSLDEISEIYKNISTKIFSQSTLKGTSSLVWHHSYYDTALWEKLLKEQWDDRTLITTRRNLKTPKFCAVSAVVNQTNLSAYVFRNYSLPCRVQSQYIGGYDHKVWECVRATAAAPTYFEEFRLGNMLHQDGGILVNNPTAIAIHEAKLLWPDTPIRCVVSFGTGRTTPNPVEPSNPMDARALSSSWKEKFLAIVHSATDTEGVHTMLSDLLLPNVYFRFNPYISEMLPIDEIDPNKLEQLRRDAVMYLRRNDDKFQAVANVLNEKKNTTQSILNWVQLQKEVLGMAQK